jgi:membrane protein
MDLIWRTWSRFEANNGMRTAAAIAFSAAFSIAPMLVLIVGVAQLFVKPEDVQGSVEAGIRSVAGEQGVEQVRTMVDGSEKSSSQGFVASTLSTCILLFGATGFFTQLQTALNDVWEVKARTRKRGYFKLLTKRILSLGMVAALGVLLLISIVTSTVIVAFGQRLGFWMPAIAEVLVTTASWLAFFAILTVLFAAVFRFLPDVKILWRDVLVGGAITAGMFILGDFAISFYLGLQDAQSIYGAAGSMIVILSWVYYSTVILLLGANLTCEWSASSGRPVVPTHGATRATPSQGNNVRAAIERYVKKPLMFRFKRDAS